MEWWTLEAASAFSKNAAQALGLFAVVGLVAGLWRLRRSLRPDIMVSFIVFLAGTGMAQLPVHLVGMTGWGIEMVTLSGAARAVQCLGVILFVRGVFRDVRYAWGWLPVTALVLGVMVML